MSKSKNKSCVPAPAPSYYIQGRAGCIPCYSAVELRARIRELHAGGCMVGTTRDVHLIPGTSFIVSRLIERDFRVLDRFGVPATHLEPEYGSHASFGPHWRSSGNRRDVSWNSSSRPRGGVIPDTGASRYHYRNYRHVPHVQAERNFAVQREEFVPKVRAKRNAVNLPSNWESRVRVVERCWKSHRATQWKPVSAD
jgi:hypothetical protein